MKQIYKKENRILLSMITGMIVISLLCGIQWRDRRKMFWHGGAVFIRSSVFQNGISMAAMSKNFHQTEPKISFWLAKAIERW